MTQTKEQVSEKARELVETFGAVSVQVGQSRSTRQVHAMQRDGVGAELLAYIASLEADAKRLDWLETRVAAKALNIAADESGEVEVFIGKGLWECYASLRDAADGKSIPAFSPSTEEVSR